MKLTDVSEGLRRFLGQRYFPSLDGIRALSVLLVMSNHLHSPNSLMRRMPGWIGVDIFCVLSGFLITTLLLREEIDFGSVRLLPFYTRRFFRIVPVFLLVLCLYIPVAYFGDHGARWHSFEAALPLYLTFMQDYVPHEAPFSSSWTLGIEEKFYFVWPILGFLIIRRPALRAFFLVGFLVVSASIYLAYESTSDRAFFHARSYAALAVGGLLACLLTSTFAKAYARTVAKIPTMMFCVALLVATIATFFNRKYVLLTDCAVAGLLSSLLLSQSLPRSLLSNRFLVWIGRRSYSMYLLHLLILNPIRAFLHPRTIVAEILVLLIAYLLTAGAAHLIFIFVEEPARQVGKKLIAKRQRRSSSPVAILDTPTS